MAYTNDEKQGYDLRLKVVKERFAEKHIKYYAPIALALDPSASSKRLNNVMNGSQRHEASLVLLERIAGIEQLESQAA
jgi:hypothetical protein